MNPEPDAWMWYDGINEITNLAEHSEAVEKTAVERIDAEKLFSQSTIHSYLSEADDREELIRRAEELAGIELRSALNIEKKNAEGDATK